jgi:hypothetical protein
VLDFPAGPTWDSRIALLVILPSSRKIRPVEFGGAADRSGRFTKSSVFATTEKKNQKQRKKKMMIVQARNNFHWN